jgi:hypothetical protein
MVGAGVGEKGHIESTDIIYKGTYNGTAGRRIFEAVAC